MDLGNRIKEVRIAKKMSQKEIAVSIGLDRGQFSRIENNKVEPNLNTLKKIAATLKVSLAELFNDGISYDIDSYNQSLVDKVKLISTLDTQQQEAIFFMIDTLSANQQLKTTLKNALNLAS